jgi:tetratricopeptide (TPR) repeat protein
MILQAWKSKLHISSFSVLMIALLLQVPAASAQVSSFDLPSGQPFESRTGQLFGTVYLNRGARPASQVVVNVRSLSSGVSQSLLTDLAGHFELRGLPPGTYEVSADEQGYRHATTIAQVNYFPSEVTLYLRSSDAPPIGAGPYKVSVRELKIPSKAQDEYQRGLDLMAKNNFAASLAHFNKATAAYPDYYEAFYEIGVAELRLEHQDKAMEAFQKAIDLSGGHYARPQFAYGLLLCNQGKAKEAEYVIRNGLDIDPNVAEGHLFLAIALLSQSRLDEAEKSLREALLRKPQYPDVYLVLADIHAKRKDYVSQVHDLDTYLKLAPKLPGIEYVRKIRDEAQRLLSESLSQK